MNRSRRVWVAQAVDILQQVKEAASLIEDAAIDEGQALEALPEGLDCSQLAETLGENEQYLYDAAGSLEAIEKLFQSRLLELVEEALDSLAKVK